jgi:homoserine O-acetyltransferase
VIGAAHESDPMTTTLRAIQRRIVSLGEKAGIATEGVALARALAMTTYRTKAEFAERFAMTPLSADEGITFPAEEYVIARGRDYAARTTPTDFRALTLSLDLHSVRPEDIKVPATLIGVLEDQLVSIEQIRELHRRIGGDVTLVELSSIHGHDSFLNDSEQMAPYIATALRKSGESRTGPIHTAHPVSTSNTFASLQ